MIIFGWGGNCRVLGEIGEADCDNCNNTARWVVVETSKKFTLYFMPVAKWSKKYFCICSVCDHGIELKDIEHAQDFLLEALEGREKAKIAIKRLRQSD